MTMEIARKRNRYMHIVVFVYILYIIYIILYIIYYILSIIYLKKTTFKCTVLNMGRCYATIPCRKNGRNRYGTDH
jgi:Trk-type K+ transport system membrane component